MLYEQNSAAYSKSFTTFVCCCGHKSSVQLKKLSCLLEKRFRCNWRSEKRFLQSAELCGYVLLGDLPQPDQRFSRWRFSCPGLLTVSTLGPACTGPSLMHKGTFSSGTATSLKNLKGRLWTARYLGISKFPPTQLW